MRIPADVDRPDRLIGSLTARQLAILAVTGLVLYTGWTATRALIPLPVFCVAAIPVGAAAAILALGQREGVSLDRLAAAAVRHHLGPRHWLAAPETIASPPEWLAAHATPASALQPPGGARTGRVSPSALRLPADAVTDTGVIDLGADGLALVAAVSTVNFALRTPAEQDALVATFGRYLHSLTAPVQVLVRTERLDLSGQIGELRQQAPSLPHPALQAAALAHADYLHHLAAQTDLLARQVLLVFREPRRTAAPPAGPDTAPRLLVKSAWRREPDQADRAARRAAEPRLARRLGEAVELLAPAGIVVTGLDAAAASAVLAAACNPDTLLPPSTARARPDEVITTASSVDERAFHVEWPGEDLDPDDDWDDDWDDNPEAIRWTGRAR